MLANSTVLLIRHAEDPEVEPQLPARKQRPTTLSPLGQARAQGYATYFQNLPFPDRRGASPAPDFLFAATGTRHSHRPNLTLQPLSKSLNLPINGDYSAGDKKTAAEHKKLAQHLLRARKFAGKNIIICWHHGHILCLAEWLLGNNPQLSSGDAPWPETWPDDVYGWLLWISYDENGNATGRCYR
jgi:hypothetical protein